MRRKQGIYKQWTKGSDCKEEKFYFVLCSIDRLLRNFDTCVSRNVQAEDEEFQSQRGIAYNLIHVWWYLGRQRNLDARVSLLMKTISVLQVTSGCERDQRRKKPKKESEFKGRRNIKNISLSLARLVHVI